LCTRRGRWWVSTGTPPVPSEARTVRRTSSRPSRPSRRRAASLDASRRASGCTVRRIAASSSPLRPKEVDLVRQRRQGGSGDLVAVTFLGDPPTHLSLDVCAQGGDPLLQPLPGDLLGQTAARLAGQQRIQHRGDQRPPPTTLAAPDR
jgi:hypothetical protein